MRIEARGGLRGQLIAYAQTDGSRWTKGLAIVKRDNPPDRDRPYVITRLTDGGGSDDAVVATGSTYDLGAGAAWELWRQRVETYHPSAPEQVAKWATLTHEFAQDGPDADGKSHRYYAPRGERVWVIEREPQSGGAVLVEFSELGQWYVPEDTLTYDPSADERADAEAHADMIETATGTRPEGS